MSTIKSHSLLQQVVPSSLTGQQVLSSIPSLAKNAIQTWLLKADSDIQESRNLRKQSPDACLGGRCV